MMSLPQTEPKAGGMRDRSVPLATTVDAVPRLRRRFGITRVGETTALDRTGIPNFCAIVPNSPDVLSVYNGKGRTPREARVSAVMEAVERQTAARANPPSYTRPMEQVLKDIDLTPLDLLRESLTSEVECTDGFDLIDERIVPVPLALVRFPWRGPRLTRRSSTNGLASGNTLTEAVYHAVTEMVERHVWSMQMVRSEILPRYYRGPDALDRACARTLVFPTGDAVLDALYERIVACGLRVRVSMLEIASFAPTALASVVEPESEPPMAHVGLGCSLSSAHAAERALTEAIQSRVVDVQAAREDIRRADDDAGPGTHGKRLASLPENRWFYDLDAPTVTLDALPELSSDDLARDVRTLVGQMRDGGIRTCAVVPILNEPDVSVVRVCAPDFETTAVDGRFGPLAIAELNPLRC